MPAFANFVLRLCFVAATASLVAVAGQPAQAQTADTSFFLTSTGIGNGGNLGGLAGVDNYCQQLAQAAGAGAKTWRAYLSTQAADGKPAVNARDRIGKGPWQNAKGVVVAKDVAELHAANNLTKQTALSEHQRPRRHAEPPRRADGIAGRRYRVRRRRRPHLQELDEQHAGGRDGRPFRSHRASRRRRLQILERVASFARAGRRLLAERPQEHRRRRAVLLFRGELRRAHRASEQRAAMVIRAARLSRNPSSYRNRSSARR